MIHAVGSLPSTFGRCSPRVEQEQKRKKRREKGRSTSAMRRSEEGGTGGLTDPGVGTLSARDEQDLAARGRDRAADDAGTRTAFGYAAHDGRWTSVGVCSGIHVGRAVAGPFSGGRA
jgi:hypothetical protein